MISKLTFKSGSSPNQDHLQVELTPITVFVGPNNSGKSKILIEIENFCKTTAQQSNQVILEDLDFIPWSKEEFETELSLIQQVPAPNESVPAGYIKLSRINPLQNSPTTYYVNRQAVINEATNPRLGNLFGQYSQFLSGYTMRLDGTNRLNLCNEIESGDLQNTSSNHLTHLFTDNQKSKEVRRIIFEAFGKYFVIDPTNIGKLRVRLSDVEPVNESVEKGWTTESVEFHRKAVELKNSSDGVKAFTGIVTTLLTGDMKVTLIDEPEAFLHPALSLKLGKEIGATLKDSNKRLFVATHNSSFLMGCIQSGIPLNIIRLTYKSGVATSRLLDNSKILKLMRQPLLRSTGVLSGLFYESVIITEADSDRAFYQEINERLLLYNDPRGIINCLFLNAQNKQTIWEVVKPLRELGIPAVAITDVDVIKEGGSVFSKLLDGAFIPSLMHPALQLQRKGIKDALDATGGNMKTDGGIQLLDRHNMEASVNFFDTLDKYGAFCVRFGELENWLKHLGASGHSPSWLIDTFEKMGDDPSDSHYVKPADGDVWDFMGKIKKWIDNQSRSGIPE